MMQTINIMIVGVGGQGTLLTSRVLGKIALTGGYDVKLSEVHGMAQRGGSVVTFVRYGESVAEPIVEEGQADILIAFERLEALRYAHFLKKGGAIIVNDTRIDPMPVVIGAAEYPEHILEELSKKYNVLAVDATAEALKLGNARVFNTIKNGYRSLQILCRRKPLTSTRRHFSLAMHITETIQNKDRSNEYADHRIIGRKRQKVRQ